MDAEWRSGLGLSGLVFVVMTVFGVFASPVRLPKMPVIRLLSTLHVRAAGDCCCDCGCDFFEVVGVRGVTSTDSFTGMLEGEQTRGDKDVCNESNE
jgi:hypothetical protein